MARITKHEFQRRLAVAQEYIEEGRWSIHDRLELAQRFDVTLDTVNSWRDRVVELEIEQLMAERDDPERAIAEMLLAIRFARRLFTKTVAITDGKNAVPGPLVKLLELEARLRGLGKETAQHVNVEHGGSISVLVARADPIAHARAVIQSVPLACQTLGIPLDPEVERLPALLEDLIEGRDLIEAIEVEVLNAE